MIKLRYARKELNENICNPWWRSRDSLTLTILFAWV